MAMKKWETLGRTFAADFFAVGDGANFGSAAEFYDELFFKVGARGPWVAAPEQYRARTDQKEVTGPETFRRSLLDVALSAPDPEAVALWRRQKADKSARKYFTTEQVAQYDTVRIYIKAFYNKVSQALETRERKYLEAQWEERKQDLRKRMQDESLTAEEQEAAKAELDSMFSNESAERYGRVRDAVETAWKAFTNADGSADDDELLVQNAPSVQPCFIALFRAAGWDLPDDMKA